MPTAEPLLACENLTCHRASWNTQSSRVEGLTLDFRAGCLHGLCGRDGSGKGLLLHLLGLLEPPDAGRVLIAGAAAPDARGEDATALRNKRFGYLFPSPCLLPSFTVAENVAMPLFRQREITPAEARDLTLGALGFVGLAEFEAVAAWRLPVEIQHRVAFARAMAHRPDILIAVSPAEPDALLPCAALAVGELGMTVLWGGSRGDLEPHCGRLLELENGRVLSDSGLAPV